ncbi:unnamed protein product, partial [Prorocentrum cordatum]
MDMKNMISNDAMRKTVRSDDDNGENRILHVIAEGLKEDADEDASTNRLQEMVDEVDYSATRKGYCKSTQSALICDSTVPFVRSLAEQDQGKATFRSISKKYSQDLEGLLSTLGTCNLHYIRCFKPNEEQKPRIFKQPLVLDQIVQCGTIELVKIMHDGYPNRCPFDEVADRFKSLLPESFQRYG